MTSRTDFMGWLKAVGEASRLRLLMLCDRQDLSVSDLARALGQSEPRVSRHLRILCESGLVQRRRQGQWVHYRLTDNAPVASFVQGLLAQIDHNDPQLERDLARALSGSNEAPGAAAQPCESRLGRALEDFMESNTTTRLECALVIGVEHLELLERAASVAINCVTIAHSRRAAQSARAFAERRGFNCRVLVAADHSRVDEHDISRAGSSFDMVLLDRLALADGELGALISSARHALAPSGRLWLFERYESLEGARGKIVEHPLARLRRLLSDLGLSCERLSPIEADGEHVLAAVASPIATKEHPALRRA